VRCDRRSCHVDYSGIAQGGVIDVTVTKITPASRRRERWRRSCWCRIISLPTSPPRSTRPFRRPRRAASSNGSNGIIFESHRALLCMLRATARPRRAACSASPAATAEGAANNCYTMERLAPHFVRNITRRMSGSEIRVPAPTTSATPSRSVLCSTRNCEPARLPNIGL
jgi:hypothetical protein